jgi:hypothetical protein
MIKNLISIVFSFIFALSLTILVEWGLSFIFLKRKEDRKVVILAQILTNPALNFLLFLNYNFFTLNQNLLLAFLEISAVTVETIVYKKCLSENTKIGSVLFSLLLNIASFAIGYLITINLDTYPLRG